MNENNNKTDLEPVNEIQDPDSEEIERIFILADRQTRTELLAVAYFFVWRSNRIGFKEYNQQNPWPLKKRILLLILGFWVYWQTRKVLH